MIPLFSGICQEESWNVHWNKDSPPVTVNTITGSDCLQAALYVCTVCEWMIIGHGYCKSASCCISSGLNPVEEYSGIFNSHLRAGVTSCWNNKNQLLACYPKPLKCHPSWLRCYLCHNQRPLGVDDWQVESDNLSCSVIIPLYRALLLFRSVQQPCWLEWWRYLKMTHKKIHHPFIWLKRFKLSI